MPHQICLDYFPLEFYLSDPNKCLFNHICIDIFLQTKKFWPKYLPHQKRVQQSSCWSDSFLLTSAPYRIRGEIFIFESVFSWKISPCQFSGWKLDFNPIVVVLQSLKTLETSLQAPSYASPKLWITHSLMGVKCRATSVAKNTWTGTLSFQHFKSMIIFLHDFLK